MFQRWVKELAIRIIIKNKILRLCQNLTRYSLLLINLMEIINISLSIYYAIIRPEPGLIVGGVNEVFDRVNLMIG
jgi:hypothetical protein